MDPSRYPLLDSDATFCNAVEHIAFPLSDKTSVGENDDSKDDVNVARSEDDLSCLNAAVTNP